MMIEALRLRLKSSKLILLLTNTYHKPVEYCAGQLRCGVVAFLMLTCSKNLV